MGSCWAPQWQPEEGQAPIVRWERPKAHCGGRQGKRRGPTKTHAATRPSRCGSQKCHAAQFVENGKEAAPKALEGEGQGPTCDPRGRPTWKPYVPIHRRSHQESFERATRNQAPDHNCKHLGAEGLPKKCSFEKTCRICRVEDDSHETDRTYTICARAMVNAESNGGQSFMKAFFGPQEDDDRKDRRRDEPASSSKGARSCGRSPERKSTKSGKDDLEGFELEDLEHMEQRIKEQIMIRKRKAMPMAREESPRHKEKRTDVKEEPKEERRKPRKEVKEEKQEEDVPDYDAEGAEEEPKAKAKEESEDESSEEASVPEEVKEQTGRDLQSSESDSDSDDRRHRPGALNLKSRTIARKAVVNEITNVLLETSKEAEVHARVKMSWIEVKAVDGSA